MPVSIPVRWRALEIALLLPVLVTAGLGWGYIRAVITRQRAVERGAEVMVRRIGDTTLALASQRGDAVAHAVLLPVHALVPRTTSAVLGAMRRAADSLARCGTCPSKEGAYRFVWIPATGRFASSTPVTPLNDPRIRLGPGFAAGLKPSPQIFAPSGTDSTGPWLLHVTVATIDGHAAIAGFDIAMDSWWTGTFEPAAREARRALFPMIANPDTAFALALLYDSTVLARDGAFAGPRARLPTVGGFSLEVSLNPAVLPTLLASASPPGYSVLFGALGASVIVSLLSIVLLRQIRRTAAQREAFVASISHEVRTPLTEILLHAESLLLNRQTPEANNRAASSIVRETRRVIGLVENALTVAGAGRSGRRDLPGPIELAPVVRESLRSLEQAAASRSARIETRLEESARSRIEPVALDRVVTNLVENALRYGPQGQTIRIVLRRDQGVVRLEVDDEGPGVPPRERQRIWDPFERGGAARQDSSRGIGLGLAIVQHLVARAGGTVAVGDNPGGGAQFRVELPAHG